jgi:hypothetical protein
VTQHTRVRAAKRGQARQAARLAACSASTVAPLRPMAWFVATSALRSSSAASIWEPAPGAAGVSAAARAGRLRAARHAGAHTHHAREDSGRSVGNRLRGHCLEPLRRVG